MPTLTRHSDSCRAAFGRHDLSCPRCQELANGAPARSSWHSSYYKQQAARAAAIRSHNCKESGCGSICTAFDW